MKFLIALLLLAPNFAQAATCNVYTESSPHIWNQRLLQIPAPAQGSEHAVMAFVPKFSKSAAVYSLEELSRRIQDKDFQDLEGGSMVYFQQSYPGRYDVTVTTIDARLSFDKMPSAMLIGGISKEVGIALLLPDQKIFVNCTEQVLP